MPPIIHVCIRSIVYILVGVTHTPMCASTVYWLLLSTLPMSVKKKSQAYYSGDIWTHNLCWSRADVLQRLFVMTDAISYVIMYKLSWKGNITRGIPLTEGCSKATKNKWDTRYNKTIIYVLIMICPHLPVGWYSAVCGIYTASRLCTLLAGDHGWPAICDRRCSALHEDPLW